MKAISKVLLAIGITAAIAALAACSSMPDWMPGSGAIKVNLSGSEEVPPLSVPGSGSGSFRVADDGTITGSVTTKDVQGTMAHIHRGAKGQNGPIVVPLTKSGDTYTAPANAKLSEADLQAFREGRLYVNVHTDRNKGGEVRGQLNP